MSDLPLPRALAVATCVFVAGTTGLAGVPMATQKPLPQRFDIIRDEIQGPGMDALRRLTINAQFVLLGEDHHDRDTPLFALALFRWLHRERGFNHAIVEQDPLGIEAISAPPLRGNATAIGTFLRQYPGLIGFASDEDLKFLAEATAIAGGDHPLYGLEQVQCPSRY